MQVLKFCLLNLPQFQLCLLEFILNLLQLYVLLIGFDILLVQERVFNSEIVFLLTLFVFELLYFDVLVLAYLLVVVFVVKGVLQFVFHMVNPGRLMLYDSVELVDLILPLALIFLKILVLNLPGSFHLPDYFLIILYLGAMEGSWDRRILLFLGQRSFGFVF